MATFLLILSIIFNVTAFLGGDKLSGIIGAIYLVGASILGILNRLEKN